MAKQFSTTPNSKAYQKASYNNMADATIHVAMCVLIILPKLYSLLLFHDLV